MADSNASISQNTTSPSSSPESLVLGGSSAQAYSGNDTITATGRVGGGNYVVGNQAISGELFQTKKPNERFFFELTLFLWYCGFVLTVATESSGLFYYDGSQGIFGLGVGVRPPFFLLSNSVASKI